MLYANDVRVDISEARLMTASFLQMLSRVGLQAITFERGFDGATIAGGARRAGMTSANVHYYFAGKQQLSDALLSGGVESRLTEMGDDELLSFVSLDLRKAVAA